MSHEHEHEHGREEEPQLTAEEREMFERRDRALSFIRQFGDPVLKSKASDVIEFGDDLHQQADQMVSLMRDALGVGLAANQIGSLRRILVYQAYTDEEPVTLVNPRITKKSEETEVMTEGCLSLPGIALDVERSVEIEVEAQDLDGKKRKFKAEDFEARVIQHEVDHLDGVMILDRTDPEQRRGALKALREGIPYSPPGSENEEDADEQMLEAEAGALE